MSREIPFFELFAQLQLSPELRLKLLGAVIASACIHQDTLSMELAMIVKHPLEPSDLDELNSAIRNGYGLNEVRFRVTLKEEQLPSQRKAAAAPSAPSGGGPSGPVLMGNPIKVKPVEMKTLDLKMGNATVSGKVFSVECVETRRPGMWRLHVEMTDYTSSVAVHKNLTEKEAKGLDGKINPGMWLCVQGKMEPTWDGKDIQLNPYHINVIQHEERQDTAPVKRVELHLHTKMSNMDALTVNSFMISGLPSITHIIAHVASAVNCTNIAVTHTLLAFVTFVLNAPCKLISAPDIIAIKNPAIN